MSGATAKQALNYVLELKGQPIKYHASQDKSGFWYVYTEELPGLWGYGNNEESALDEMIAIQKELAQKYLALSDEVQESERVKYLVKVILSSAEELKGCLVGEN